MKIDKNFYDFLVAQSTDPGWFEKMKQKYQDNCFLCQPTNTETVVSLKFVVRCKECGKYSEIPAHKASGPYVLADRGMFGRVAHDLKYGIIK